MPLRLQHLIALSALILPIFTGCASGGAYDGSLGRSDSKGLGIVGYNYTDKYIDSFLVNGAGGGNLSAHGGGGKISCCVMFNPHSKLPFPVTIRWTDAYHKLPKIGNFGDKGYEMVRDWKETTVMFNGPVPKDPKYFEVYFYPNNEIRLGITSEMTEYRDHLPSEAP